MAGVLGTGAGTDKSMETLLGKALASNVDRVFGAFRLRLATDGGRSRGRTYVVFPVDDVQLGDLTQGPPNVPAVVLSWDTWGELFHGRVYERSSW